MARTADAPTVSVAIDFQIGEDIEDPQLGGCLELAVAKAGRGDEDDRLDMRAIHDGCEGAQVTAEAIGVGDEVWVRKGTGDYSSTKSIPACCRS